jgi:histidinol-phosphate aminotransferase
MNNSIDRRNWIKSAGLLSTGLAMGPIAAFAGSTEISSQSRTWERNLRPSADLEKIQVRLNANENVFGPSEKVRLAVMESVSMGNRYGHEDAMRLISMIAEKENVPKECIMLGPGSTDLLEKAAITHFIGGGNIVAADPAYMSLIKTAMAFSATWKNVPLKADWSHDLTSMLAAIDKSTKMVYVCNPNNPTGSITNATDLRNFCRTASDKAPIFVDEAYLEYLDNPVASSMVDLVREGKNVIVSRTFSKVHAMAGLRIGYIVAIPATLKKIDTMVRGNMGLSITSIRGAIASMQDTTFHLNASKWTKESREFTQDQLKSMGFTYVPSYTSFILFPIQMEGEPFLKKMTDEGIGVRAFDVFGKPYCRVSMGTMPEMKLFTAALKKVLV